MKKLLGILFAFFISIPVFSNGVDFGKAQFNNPSQSISLNGKWEFYPNNNFTTIQDSKEVARKFITVPGSWDINAEETFRKSKNACYRIIIKGKEIKPNTQYAIYSPHCPSSASRFYCNGKLFASYGEYSTDEKTAKPDDIPVYAFFDSGDADSLELVVQVSNFSSYESGIVSPIMFGKRDVITKRFVINILFVMILAGGLVFVCIVNFSIFIGNKSLKIHLIFGLLLLGLFLNLVAGNSNLISWTFPGLSYKFIKNLGYIKLWLSPMLFAKLMEDDKVFTKKLPYVDKAIIGIFAFFAIGFMILPIDLSNKLVAFCWLFNLLFCVYSIVRMALCFATKQIKLGIFISFYILISVGFFVDVLFKLNASTITPVGMILCNQIAILILELFDVFFMAWNHLVAFHQTENAIDILSIEHSAYKKFVSSRYLKLINKNHPESVKSGDNNYARQTIMQINLIPLYSDGRILQPRAEFDANSQFTKIIYDVIDQNNGILATSTGDGCIALFNEKSPNVLKAAREIIRGIRRLNELNVKLGEASAMFSCAIHTGEFLAGVVGDKDSYSECLLGPAMQTTLLIEKTAQKYGVPILVSKTTVDLLEGEKPCKLSLFSQTVITEYGEEIKLYECYDEDYEIEESETSQVMPVQ